MTHIFIASTPPINYPVKQTPNTNMMGQNPHCLAALVYNIEEPISEAVDRCLKLRDASNTSSIRLLVILDKPGELDHLCDGVKLLERH